MKALNLWVDGEFISDAGERNLFGNRGLQYGDGLFETMWLQDGKIRLLEYHIQRLQDGCRRLQIGGIEPSVLYEDFRRLPTDRQPLIVKLMVIRGGVGRGYRPARESYAQRWLSVFPSTEAPRRLAVKWCETRLSRNPLLAGIKHLNRLEQVLAQQELEICDEGLMLDTEGNLISATAGNVFLVRDGEILTPALNSCGIAGVMRRHVMEIGRVCGWQVHECNLSPKDVEDSQEIFITNAIRGIRAVSRVGTREFESAPISDNLSRMIFAQGTDISS